MHTDRPLSKQNIRTEVVKACRPPHQPADEAVFRVRNFGAALGICTVALNAAALAAPLFIIVFYTGGASAQQFARLLAVLGVIVAGQLAYEWMCLLRTSLLYHFANAFEASFARLAFRANAGLAGLGAQGVSPGPIRDLDRVRELILGPGVVALCDLPFSAVFLVFLTHIHSALGAICLGFGVVLCLLELAAQRLQAGEPRSSRRPMLKHADALQQGLRPVESLEALWLEQRTALYTERRDARTWPSFLRSIARAGKGAHLIAITVVATFLTAQGITSFGAILASAMLARKLLEPLESFTKGWRSIRAGLVAYRRVKSLTTPARRESNDKVESEGDFCAAGLRATGGPAERCSRPLSFQIARGEVLGVTGPSGCGKTRLAKLIAGVPDSGTGYMTHVNFQISGLEEQKRSDRVGYLSQSSTFFSGTLAWNIAHFSDPDPGRVLRALQLSGSWDFVSGLRSGFDTEVGEILASAPRGALQRLAIARAIYHEPRLLVLDDPSSHLDAEGMISLVTLIETHRHNGGMAIVCTNEQELLARCNRILTLQGDSREGIAASSVVSGSLTTPNRVMCA